MHVRGEDILVQLLSGTEGDASITAPNRELARLIVKTLLAAPVAFWQWKRAVRGGRAAKTGAAGMCSRKHAWTKHYYYYIDMIVTMHVTHWK
jgi:hypothetical protein